MAETSGAEIYKSRPPVWSEAGDFHFSAHIFLPSIFFSKCLHYACWPEHIFGRTLSPVNGQQFINFNGANSQPGGFISQTFGTTVGDLYQVSFFGSSTFSVDQ
jgi:hypothetical protein